MTSFEKFAFIFVCIILLFVLNKENEMDKMTAHLTQCVIVGVEGKPILLDRCNFVIEDNNQSTNRQEGISYENN